MTHPKHTRQALRCLYTNSASAPPHPRQHALTPPRRPHHERGETPHAIPRPAARQSTQPPSANRHHPRLHVPISEAPRDRSGLIRTARAAHCSADSTAATSPAPGPDTAQLTPRPRAVPVVRGQHPRGHLAITRTRGPPLLHLARRQRLPAQRRRGPGSQGQVTPRADLPASAALSVPIQPEGDDTVGRARSLIGFFAQRALQGARGHRPGAAQAQGPLLRPLLPADRLRQRFVTEIRWFRGTSDTGGTSGTCLRYRRPPRCGKSRPSL
jgi:hypothetical protein